jgi:ABC-type Mn2+/Zn2+ transport system ATPase subunit
VQAGSDAADQTDHTCILVVEGLGVRYGDRTALKDISFCLDSGDCVAVVGPNGAGKSTLFKAVAGLQGLSAGEITVHGHEPGVGVCVAYVQQRSQIDWAFPLSVREVVMMGRAGHIGLFGRPDRSDRRHVADALTTMDLAELAERQIGELSGGQQQRMFIARALAQEAELVLMDEPLTGLDYRSRRDTLTLLDALREKSVSIMVATHDLELAAQNFDLVMLLNRRIIGFGEPQEVFTEENLVDAYGGGVTFLKTDAGAVMLGDVGGHAGRAGG